MGREKLEVLLDRLFANRISSPKFLAHCVEELNQRTVRGVSTARTQKLTAEIKLLRGKRERVIDGFIEGAIGREDRDRRLTRIDHDIQVAKDILTREVPTSSLDEAKLIETFAPLAEWEYWTRGQKRAVLSALVPDIRVADYKVESLGIDPSVFSTNDTRAAVGILIAEAPLVYLPLKTF